MRKIPMKKVREVIRLHSMMQLSSRKIKGATGVARSTIQEYIKRFESSGLTMEQIDTLDDKTLQTRLFKETCEAVAPKKAMPDFDYIHTQLKHRKQTKVTLTLLWEEYKQSYPEGYEYTQFRVHYRRYKQKLNPSMRQVHIGGEKLFVDYSGMTMPIHNAQTGQIEKAQIFVAVLGASGYTFVHATPSQKQEAFIDAHVSAYHYFGGTPRIVVPDNLKSAVISNNKEGVVINESYADLARYYQMAVEPARPYKPKDKAKAEQGVQGIQRYILARLRHQKFFDIDALNDAIAIILDDYNNKVVKHLQRSRREMFELLDKPHLRTLPANRYRYRRFKLARVNQDYHITLEKCSYSVPYAYLKEQVEVRYSTQSVEIYHNNTLIATHPRLRRIGAVSTLDEHMPPDHQYIHEKMNPERLRSWAKGIGEYSAAFVEAAFASVQHPPAAYRRVIAVLSLAKIYGQSELELALMYALEQQTLKTKSVKSILDKKLYLGTPANNPKHTPSLFNTHTNLRGADAYK